MKYNLKNRPKSWSEDETQSDDYYIYKDNVVEWFEGFKKELKEWYGQCIVDGVIPHSLVYILIKEILGE